MIIKCPTLTAVALSSSLAYGAILRHALSSNDSMFSAQSQHTCATYLHQPSPHWCNPALFSFANEPSIKADVALNVDQDAYDTTNRFLNEPITKNFVEHLFKEKDFQSFSGLVRLEAVSPYLSFSYTPAYLIGAYRLSNPNLPEVSAAAARESQVRITSGTQLINLPEWKLYGGASLFTYDRRVYYVQANALEVVVKDVDALVTSEETKGVNGDLGLFAKDDADALPSFSLVAENVFLPQESHTEDSRVLDLEPHFRRRVRLGSGYSFRHTSGHYFLGVQAPFMDALKTLDRYGASLGLTYGIGRLRAFTSLSPLMSAFGFVFLSAYYHVGIQYSNDKQDNSLELRRRRNVYLFASFNF